MSSVVAFEPYVVRVGRGDPFIQSAIYRQRITRGVLFGPNFVTFRSEFSNRGVSFSQ
jgi:hypothetical protein